MRVPPVSTSLGRKKSLYINDLQRFVRVRKPRKAVVFRGQIEIPGRVVGNSLSAVPFVWQ